MCAQVELKAFKLLWSSYSSYSDSYKPKIVKEHNKILKYYNCFVSDYAT